RDSPAARWAAPTPAGPRRARAGRSERRAPGRASPARSRGAAWRSLRPAAPAAPSRLAVLVIHPVLEAREVPGRLLRARAPSDRSGHHPELSRIGVFHHLGDL